jgi:3-hydroxyisobutyrate dehydrogenase-like beta-hydroxyacid dehydrogenase
MKQIDRFAFVGFGEAGGILGAALAAKGVHVAMFDVLLDDPGRAAAMREKASHAKVQACGTLTAAIDGAQIIVSAVTAASDVDVAEAVARCIAPGQAFLDINSVSPHTKQHGQRCIEAAGGSYVESAVMAPVPPYGLAVPMLLGGTHAEAVAEPLRALGFNARAVSTKVGVASAAKMCRSVMIKGIEALTVECLSAARHYDAETIVLASLKETFGKMQRDEDVPGYLISRVAEHGSRRAAEMREVAQTLKDAHIDPLMSEACAKLQDGLVDAMDARGVHYDAFTPFVWQDLLDALSK